MPIAHFLIFTCEPGAAHSLRAQIEAGPQAALERLPGIERIDAYTPAPSSDPYVDDGPGPALTIQTCYRDLHSLESALASPVFADLPRILPGNARVTHDAMEMHFYPVAGERSPAEWTAPVSYVVRYHRPAEDERAFVAFYTGSHPPLLGRLPGIRNIMCYLPIAWRDSSGLEHSDYLLGNEVVFDSTEALDAALASPVRDALREDFHRFPPFSGRNTHYAMLRRRLR